MPFSGLIKLIGKAFRFTVRRPVQRFNIYERSKKYLGPDAKYFLPAPRAIGSLSQIKGKPPQYPHLEGFKSVHHKRLASSDDHKGSKLQLSPQSSDDSSSHKSFSRTETDDILVIDTSTKLEVVKTTTILESEKTISPQKITSVGKISQLSPENSKLARPLPKSSELDLRDASSIWKVRNTPPGRLNLDMLQELMINKLADEKYWTSDVVAKRYNIKEEYAETLMKTMTQIRIIVSPRMSKLLDYVGQNDPLFMASRDTVYYVDKNLRTEKDRECDGTFCLETEQLDDEVRELLETSQSKTLTEEKDRKDIESIRRAQPLRLLNQPLSQSINRRDRQQSPNPTQEPVKQLVTPIDNSPSRQQHDQSNP